MYNFSLIVIIILSVFPTFAGLRNVSDDTFFYIKDLCEYALILILLILVSSLTKSTWLRIGLFVALCINTYLASSYILHMAPEENKYTKAVYYE